MYKFSAKENAFYPVSIIDSYIDLPSDLIDVEEKTFIKFACEQPPAGKVRGSNSLGLPVWVAAPKPSNEEIISDNLNKKEKLLSEVMDKIKLLQFSVELDMASDSEIESLADLKRYAVELNRVDTTKTKISWPIIPG